MMLGGGGAEEGDGTLERIMAQIGAGGVPAASTSGGGQRKGVMMVGERVPQWGQQETREFIAIRAELERDFTASRRNKTLWEAVSSRMRDKGYHRSPEQCKCKWKNLVNRYKGKETSDPEIGKQCPFFDELHAVFAERARNMERLLLVSESGVSHSKKKPKRLAVDRYSSEFSEDDIEEGDDSDDEHLNGKGKRRKTDKDRQAHPPPCDKPSRASDSIPNILLDFFQMQQRMELQWREAMERRAQERQLFEQEWRQTMEKLERERLVLEQAWREREEQRRIREETRAERRDALLTTLLNKLIQEGI